MKIKVRGSMLRAGSLGLASFIACVGRMDAKCDIPEEFRRDIRGSYLNPVIENKVLIVSHSEEIRILKPDMPTAGARDDRVNIQIDEFGRILDVRCDVPANAH